MYAAAPPSCDGERLAFVVLHVGDDDACAFGDEFFDGGATHAACAAGDDRHFAAQTDRP